MTMKVIHPTTGHPALTTALTLAHVLERLERSPQRVDPAQYRFVAQRLADAIVAVPSGAPLEALLNASAAAAEIYENLNFQHAGLCRSPLEASMNAELRTRDAVARAQSNAPADPAR